MAMSRWIRRILGTLALGGGAVGLSTMALAVPHATGVIAGTALLTFAAIYVFGIWCGIGMLEQRPGAEGLNSVYWLLQVPTLNTYGLSYLLVSGLGVTLGLGWNPIHFKFAYAIGSAWYLYLFTTPDETWVGINIVALGIACFLRALEKHQGRMPVLRTAITEET